MGVSSTRSTPVWLQIIRPNILKSCFFDEFVGLLCAILSSLVSLFVRVLSAKLSGFCCNCHKKVGVWPIGSLSVYNFDKENTSEMWIEIFEIRFLTLTIIMGEAPLLILTSTEEKLAFFPPPLCLPNIFTRKDGSDHPSCRIVEIRPLPAVDPLRSKTFPICIKRQQDTDFTSPESFLTVINYW